MNTYALQKREVISILFKEKHALIGTFLIVTLVIFGLSFLMSPKYEADAKFIIKSGREFQNRPDPGQQAATLPYLTKQEIMNSELEILSSNDLAQETITRIGLEKLYPQLKTDADENSRAMDSAIKLFKKSLKSETAMMSEVITVSFVHKDRAVAVEALHVLLQAYQDKHTNLFSENRSAFLEKKTKDYMDQLDSVSQKITTLRQTENIYDVAAQRGQLIQDRSVVAETLRSLETRALDQHGRQGYYTDRLKNLSPFATSEIDENGQAHRVASVHDWKAKDPAYVDPVYDDAVLKLQSAQADASALDQQIALQRKTLETMDERLKSIEGVARTLETLEREHAMLDTLVRTSRASYEQALTNEDLDRQKIVSVDVFEKPDASSIPTKPNHVMFALAGMALGLMGALSILGYSMIFRQTLISAESVERMLGIKVLATVPERG